MNAILQDLPLPARLVPWPKASLTTVTRCLVLALLLHLWLVLWLGNAPGGTAPLGQGVFGAINVTLRGPVTEGAAAVFVPSAPANDTPGDAAAPRWGGAVRSAEPLPDSAPGAARLGEHRTLPLAAPAQPSAASVVPEQPTAVTVPPAPTLASPPVPLPAPSPAPSPAPLPARVLQDWQVATPAAARVAEPLPSATAPPLPAAAALPPVPTPNAVIAASRPERQLASPLSHPSAAAPVAPLSRVAQPAALPELAVPPPLAAAPQAVRRLQAPPATERMSEPELSRNGEVPPVAMPAAAALPRAAVATARSAADDGGAQVGRDVATSPAAAASAVPRLNLELMRPRGGELSRLGTNGVLQVLPRLPERDEKLAKEIEKAGKTDCRNAYSGMGPLAVIPLALDAVRKDGGCKW